MKHVTTADKSLLVGDAAADALLAYAALLANVGRGDSVLLRAIGIDGEQVTAGFLLNSGTTLLTESTTSALPEPDNDEAIAYMRERIASYRQSSFPDLGEGVADPGGDGAASR